MKVIKISRKRYFKLLGCFFLCVDHKSYFSVSCLYLTYFIDLTVTLRLFCIVQFNSNSLSLLLLTDCPVLFILHLVYDLSVMHGCLQLKLHANNLKKKSYAYSYCKYFSSLSNNFYPFFIFILTLLVLIMFPSLICIWGLTAYLSSYTYIDNSTENLIFNKRLSFFNKVHLVQIGFILPRPLLQLFLFFFLFLDIHLSLMIVWNESYIIIIYCT